VRRLACEASDCRNHTARPPSPKKSKASSKNPSSTQTTHRLNAGITRMAPARPRCSLA
jgi:hypothetical protein